MTLNFEEFIGKKIILFVDVGSSKPFKYAGVIECVNNGFVKFLDDKEGITYFNQQRVIDIIKQQ